MRNSIQTIASIMIIASGLVVSTFSVVTNSKPTTGHSSNALTSMKTFDTEVSGSLYVGCSDIGSIISIDITGLIPFGTYNIESVTVQQPGYNQAEQPEELITIYVDKGIGPSKGFFTANGKGQGTLEFVAGEEDFNEFGDVPPCSLSEIYEWRVAGVQRALEEILETEGDERNSKDEKFSFVVRV